MFFKDNKTYEESVESDFIFRYSEVLIKKSIFLIKLNNLLILKTVYHQINQGCYWERKLNS